MNLLITGGAGFIGSHFLHWLSSQYAHDEHGGVGKLINLDAFTYAGNPANLAGIDDQPYYVEVQGDIANRELVRTTLHDYQIDAVIHFAAESHVDRSIDSADRFVHTNVTGTYHLLDTYLGYLRDTNRLADCQRSLSAGGRGLFLNVSTDEVFGSLPSAADAFKETSPYAPNSPYSASKAAADHMARAYFQTYGLPVVQSNSSNNYGPRQFPEKFIPLLIRNALTHKPLPIYGDGLQVRDWLHVSDHCRALDTLLLCARPGSRYLIGGNHEMTNLQVAHEILAAVREIAPDRAPSADAERIEFVRDRPGHDRRYAVDTTAIRRDFGWRPLKDFPTGLRETVRWYLDHEDWCHHIESTRYRGERLGTRCL